MAKRVVIIGAGIAGLSTGCYLQMNGYETEIFEMHSAPGGLCTSWKRKEYTFDGCIHWLVGSSPSVSVHRVWMELHAIQGKEIVDFDEFCRIEGRRGEVFTVYTDADRLEEEMLRIAPEDERAISEFMGAVRKFAEFDLPVDKAPELYGPIDGIKFLLKFHPYLRLLRAWKGITIGSYAKRFKNPFLREAFPLILGIDEQCTMVVLIATLSWMHLKSAGYPIGGSLEFARSIEKRYISLGGKVHYNSKVSKIVVKNNRAVGVKLADGEVYDADIVVSAADGHYTIFEMLDGKYVDEEIMSMYSNWKLFPAICQVSLGVARSFDGHPHALNFPLDTPLLVDSENRVERLFVRIYNFDPTLAPKGKTPVILHLPADHGYWTRLREADIQKYRREKERLATSVIDILDKKLGDIASRVEVYDVATPATYIRYTNNWKGSFEGWLPTPSTFGKRIRKTLPGLKNFYMVGQWVEPGGGLPAVALSGRNLAQIICKKDGRKFHAFV
ncbi:MAG: NAD(P)/FAD-dependent oxidoreductase [Thermoproteota archaeon]|nr:MAG: NAD(P)/FAD-dependent oxidoreductase [Candidatus Korarchaeota archaeon]